MADSHEGSRGSGARRVAALYDIHGNLPALEAVLEEIDALDVDRVVIGGDIVWGPWPKETLDLVRSRSDAVSIRGNADREVAARMGEAEGLPPDIAEVTLWVADQLSADDLHWLGELPETASASIPGLGNVLFCHGSPRSDEEIITLVSPEERVTPMLKDVTEEVVVCGHTHSQFDRRIGRHRIVNAGSVGMPYESEAGAYWALVGDDMRLQRTVYDVAKAARGMRTTSCPGVDEGAALIEQPLDPLVAAEHFEAIARDRGN